MDIQQQFPSLLASIDNLPLHVLVSVLEYLDQETKLMISDNTRHNHHPNRIFLKLVSLSLFSQKYLRCTDRSVYLSFYSDPAFGKYEKNLLADICVRDPYKYLRIQTQITQLLGLMDSQLQCLESRQSLIQIIENLIRDPQIPFPKMRKEGIAMHCNSSLQHALVDVFFEADQADDFVEQCVLDLQQFFQCLQDSVGAILQQSLKVKGKNKSTITIIKQCYYHPQILTLQNYKDYLIKQLTSFNIYVLVHALLSGVAQMYHEYILDQCKQFERFIEFLMRYSIYRSSVLSFQTSKLSKILYKSVGRVLDKVIKINDDLAMRIEDLIIPEAPIRLQNKISEDNDLDCQELALVPNISRISSQAKTYKSAEAYKNINFQMTSRMFLAGGKIWASQCRRVKQLNQQTSSPSRYLNLISQETVNNRNYIKILNRLVHYKLLQKLQEEVQSNCKMNLIRESSPPLLRDEDIVNIFGHNYEGQEIESPTYSHSSTYGNPPLSPVSPYSNFNQMMRSFSDLSCNSAFTTIMMAVQNKIRSQPYRFQKGNEQLHYNNETCSNSPDKQKEKDLMPQIHFQSFNKIPSLREKKLLSKTSMVSKFTKISQSKAMGSVQDLFESEISIQEQILMQYHSYLIDLSVNEMSVHWIGHSEQYLMGDAYRHFQEYFLRFNQGFMCYLVKIIGQAAGKIEQETLKARKCQKNKKQEFVGIIILRRVLQMYLQYLDTGFVGKKTLNKLLKTANQIIVTYSNKYKSYYHETQPQTQPQKINLHIEQINKMIEHYNLEMWRVDRNVSEEKLKVYERRKSSRNVIQVLRCQNENKEQNQGKKPERKRRNSEQVLIPHNIE